MLGNVMPLYPGWADIAVRLVLTAIAGTLVGLDRQSGGHSAGFRTTVLVGLAACLAMIQANILLSVQGKTEHSFAVMARCDFRSACSLVSVSLAAARSSSAAI